MERKQHFISVVINSWSDSLYCCTSTSAWERHRGKVGSPGVIEGGVWSIVMVVVIVCCLDVLVEL